MHGKSLHGSNPCVCSSQSYKPVTEEWSSPPISIAVRRAGAGAVKLARPVQAPKCPPHPGFMNGICIRCGALMTDLDTAAAPNVALRYVSGSDIQCCCKPCIWLNYPVIAASTEMDLNLSCLTHASHSIHDKLLRRLLHAVAALIKLQC